MPKTLTGDERRLVRALTDREDAAAAITRAIFQQLLDEVRLVLSAEDAITSSNLRLMQASTAAAVNRRLTDLRAQLRTEAVTSFLAGGGDLD